MEANEPVVSMEGNKSGSRMNGPMGFPIRQVATEDSLFSLSLFCLFYFLSLFFFSSRLFILLRLVLYPYFLSLLILLSPYHFFSLSLYAFRRISLLRCLPLRERRVTFWLSDRCTEMRGITYAIVQKTRTTAVLCMNFLSTVIEIPFSTCKLNRGSWIFPDI